MLNRLLDDYTQRILSGGSLLVRVLGVFMLQSIENYSADLIIMENITSGAGNFTYQFDLKGSTFDRTEGKRSECSSLSFLKDQNFLSEVSSFNLEAEDSRRFLSGVEADIEMLRKHGVMDYSLFGAFFSHQEPLASKYCFRQKGTCNFFTLGLIDLLQEYSANKRCEHWMKRVFKQADPTLLSSVAPNLYADRLIELCRQIGKC